MSTAEEWAEKIVAQLMERRDLELVTPSTREVIVSLLAFILEHRLPPASDIAARIIAEKGVAELHCEDDELAKIIAATKPTTAPIEVPPPAPAAPAAPRSYPKLDRGAQLMLVAAQKLADDRKHRDVTLYHALVAMLDSPPLVELAKRRGGNPDAARDRAMRELELTPKANIASLDQTLTNAISAAQELAPNLANAGDIALAVLHMPDRAERGLYQLAFSPPAVVQAVPALESEEDDETPESPPASTSKRAPGALVTSADFARVWRIIHAVALRDGERWAGAERRIGELRVRAIADAEAELGTVLPDDFWAAAAAGVLQFSRLGITSTTDHGEPVPAEHETSCEAESLEATDRNAGGEHRAPRGRRGDGGPHHDRACKRGLDDSGVRRCRGMERLRLHRTILAPRGPSRRAYLNAGDTHRPEGDRS